MVLIYEVLVKIVYLTLQSSTFMWKMVR